MEQRLEHRVTMEQLVNVTTLGEPEKNFTATVTNASGRGLGLISDVSVQSGAAVKIAIGDSIFLGEAIYSRPKDGGGYFLGIELTQVLSGLAALSRMAEEFTAAFDPVVSKRR